MKCHILFSGKNKKNIISLSSAENAQSTYQYEHISKWIQKKKKKKKRIMVSEYLG